MVGSRGSCVRNAHWPADLGSADLSPPGVVAGVHVVAFLVVARIVISSVWPFSVAVEVGARAKPWHVGLSILRSSAVARRATASCVTTAPESLKWQAQQCSCLNLSKTKDRPSRGGELSSQEQEAAGSCIKLCPPEVPFPARLQGLSTHFFTSDKKVCSGPRGGLTTTRWSQALHRHLLLFHLLGGGALNKKDCFGCEILRPAASG